jgi:hypothetical protein
MPLRRTATKLVILAVEIWETSEKAEHFIHGPMLFLLVKTLHQLLDAAGD